MWSESAVMIESNGKSEPEKEIAASEIERAAIW